MGYTLNSEKQAAAAAVVIHGLNASGFATPVTFGALPVLITTKTTTLLKTGPGIIADLEIQQAGSTDTILVYDGIDASGTLIGSFAAPSAGQIFLRGRSFVVGCCAVTGGTTAGKYGFGII